MNLALFGASFDPPHFGHDLIIKKSLKILDIDKLVIMPAFLNPFKSKTYAPSNLRLKWVKKIWGNLSKVEISEFEISQNRATFTIESVKMLIKKYSPKNFYLIIGEDNLKNLKSWHNFKELNTLVKFIVFSRDELNYKSDINLQKIGLNANISSTLIRKDPLNSRNLAQIKDEIIKFYKRNSMQEKIVKILDDKKASDIEVVDMRGKDYISDFVIIASTLSPRHGFSLVDELKSNLKAQFYGIESSDDWIVIDLGDIVVHLMSKEYRAKYNIEEFLEKLKEIKG